jgi:hypothetical protein
MLLLPCACRAERPAAAMRYVLVATAKGADMGRSRDDKQGADGYMVAERCGLLADAGENESTLPRAAGLGPPSLNIRQASILHHLPPGSLG